MVKHIEPGSAEWEAICQRCGRCCYEKYEYRNKIFYTKTACQFLDTKQKRCKIYHDRSRVQPQCAILTPEIVRAGILPPDCPYVRNLSHDEKSDST